MTDPIADPSASSGHSDAPQVAHTARESHAGPGDRRGSHDSAHKPPPHAEAPSGHRPTVSASASQAAELARLSLGIAGFVLIMLMGWLMFSSSSSPWVKPIPGTVEGSAAWLPADPVTMARQAGSCGAPVTMAAAPGDGKLPLKADVTGLLEADIESFVVIGKEAAASGRPRDAESAFLMSCRVAGQLKGAESLDSARAKYQLGWLYAQLAVTGGAGMDGAREEMMGRAAQLYAESLRLFVVHADQAGKKPQLVVETTMPFTPATPSIPPAARSSAAADSSVTAASGALAPVALNATAQVATLPAEPASAGSETQPTLASASLASDNAAPAPAEAASRSQKSPAATALAAPPAVAQARVATSGRARASLVKRSDRRVRAERKVISASAAANLAELYRGR